LFVVRIAADRRQVIVGPREALLTRALSLKETNWIGDGPSIEDAVKRQRPVLARVRSTREPVLGRLAGRFPRLRLIRADAAHGAAVGWAKRFGGRALELVRKPAGQVGFVVRGRRWVVERTFAWLMRSRRPPRDYVRTAASSEAMDPLLIHLITKCPFPT